jgi:hypothetical protein
VNDGLAHGRFFFMDIARDGNALYQSDDTELHEPKPKTPEQALAMAKEYFEEWFPSGSDFFDDYRDAERRGNRRVANVRFPGGQRHLRDGGQRGCQLFWSRFKELPGQCDEQAAGQHSPGRSRVSCDVFAHLAPTCYVRPC